MGGGWLTDNTEGGGSGEDGGGGGGGKGSEAERVVRYEGGGDGKGSDEGGSRDGGGDSKGSSDEGGGDSRRGWLDNEVVLMLGLPAGDVKWLACRGLKVHLVEGG